MTEKIQTLLAGRWRDASGSAYETEYPHDGSAVAQLHAATVGDVDEAVQTAEQARLQPAWARLMPHERAGMLHRIAKGIRDQSETLAQLQRLDNGKPIKECRALVASAAGTFQYFAAAAETWEDAVTPLPMLSCHGFGSADCAQASAGIASSVHAVTNRFHIPFTCVIA